MSSYSRPNTIGNIYNPNGFVGLEESGTKLILDLSNYVRKDSGVFTGDLTTDGGLILDNTRQRVAFSDAKDALLTITSNKTNNISVFENTTTISGTVNIPNALTIPDNNLSISKIAGLQNKLTNIDTSLNEILNNDTDISNIQSNIAILQAYDVSNSTNISNLQTGQATNTSSIGTINTTLGTHSTHLSNIDTTLNTHLTNLATLNAFQTTQNTYNTTNTTNISNIQSKNTAQDTSLNAIKSYQSTNDVNISNIQSKNTQQDTSLNNILTSISTLQNADITLQANITSNDNSITSLNSSVGTLNTLTGQHTTNLSNLDSLTIQHTTNLSNLQTLTNTHTTDIVALQTQDDVLISDISALETLTTSHTTDIATKQAIINSSNRLNASYIADGSISNAQYQTLYGINTTSSIESRLTTLTNTINSLDIDITTLEALQNIDLTNFSNIGTDLTNLQNKDTQIDTSLNNIIIDVSSNSSDISNLQSNVSSNTGRLNVKDSEISTINSTLTTNIGNISTNTSDIGTLQSGLASAQSDILTKHPTIDINNKLTSSLIVTNVDLVASTLNLVLQDLTDINTTQSATITSINDSITSLTNQIANNDTEIASLQTQDVTHTNLINSIIADVSQNTVDILTKENIIDINHKINTAFLYDTNETDTVENIIIRIDADINTKQNIIDTSNKLLIAHVDLTGSNLINADYASSINSKFTSLDGQISTLTTLQNGDISNFVAIDDNFTAMDLSLNELYTRTTKFNYLDNVTSDLQNQIDNVVASSLPSMSYNSGNTTTTIANNTAITKIIFSGDATEQITAFTTALKSDLETNTSQVLTNTSNIATNTSDIALKQNIIDGSNKLLISNVDLTGSNLLYADYGSSINSKFGTIDSTLSSQATTNSSVSTSIINLSTGKQDLLDATNKLNPQFILCSGAGELTSTKTQYLSSIDADIATKFTGKADINNPTFTGSVTIPNLILSGPLSTKSISENIASTFTSFASNILTYAFTNNSVLYFNGLTANTNFKLALTSVPTTAYFTQTFSLLIGVGTFKAFANTCSINGTNYTIIVNGGLANVNLGDVTTSGLILQQFTIIYLNSGVFKVLSNVSKFY